MAALKAIRFSINIALKQLGNDLFYHTFSLLPYVVNYERCCSFPLISFYLAGSMYQYFVKIVPTIYRKLNGEVSTVL